MHHGLVQLICSKRVVLVFQQCRCYDTLVENTFHVTVVVGAFAVFVHLPHRVEEVALFHVFDTTFCAESLDDTLVGRIVVVVAHHHDLGVRFLGQDGVGDMTA